MKDRVKTEGITIMYCPTEQMLADFFTKPLQGSLFEKLRKVLMGHAHINTLSSSSLLPVEERVGEKSKLEKKERRATGRNDQDASVRTDVTSGLKNEWMIVTGRTRTNKMARAEKSVPMANESPRRMKTRG